MQTSFQVFALAFVLSHASFAQDAVGQSNIDLARVRLCTGCELKLEAIVSFGADTGAGMIESEMTQVTYDADARTFAAFVRRSSSVLLFDQNGRYLRTIGRLGRGPAELFRIVDVQLSGSQLVLLDMAPKVVVMDLAGQVISESSLRIPPSSFRIADDSTLVVGSMIRSRDLVGYPLHLVRKSTGQAIAHFGSLDGQFTAAEPLSDFVLLGMSSDRNRIWHGRLATLHLEEWSITNRLLRTIKGDIEWFGRGAESQGGPRVTIQAFGIDDRQRLWVLSQVPDANWREAPRHGNEGYVLEKDLSQFVDTQVDVFDLASRSHVGRVRFDGSEVGLVMMGSAIRVQRVTVDERHRTRVVLYGLR